MKYKNIREEELKNKVAQDYFADFDATKIIGNIDFCVTLPTAKNEIEAFETQSLLWAEAKKGTADIFTSLVQLILTIGKARTFDKQLPPAFLGAFDAEKIAFIPYNDIQEVFYQNDFNWNVTPSNHDTKEFKQVYNAVKSTIEENSLLFAFGQDDRELQTFIKENFVEGKANLSKVKIDKNNFMVIYNKWLSSVKPSIAVRWEAIQKLGIIDGDFYLADLLSHNNETLKEKLYVLLQQNHYELDRKMDDFGFFSSKKASFTDKQKAHQEFWNKYERPPKEEYWDYIIKRRDLLVPQDVRERKGSFFTPKIWVELSQKYIADVLGEDWQDEYYIWDCAAGTGNLLAGLTNKYNIWASTLDRQDVDVMHDRIDNGANLLKNHVFQFDFLNDDFTKLPQKLQKIINNPEKRKKLIIYINPPYAEHGNNAGRNAKKDVNKSKIHDKYHPQLAGANRELFAQFLIRIYNELPNCIIGEFSKLKTLSGSHFKEFRENFKPKLEKIFIVPANTFDNVKGQFPIGFKIWNTNKKEIFKEVYSDIFDKGGNKLGKKGFYSYKGNHYYSVWVNYIKIKSGFEIGWLQGVTRNDFQTQNGIDIRNKKDQFQYPRGLFIYAENLIECSICYAVRKSIPATWLNDRDQFLYPNDKWKKDREFQNDCLTYTLFNNNIQSQYGINYWIPFREQEVNAQEKFESNFMADFMAGKIQPEKSALFKKKKSKKVEPLVFSAEAKAVFEAGKLLWIYYHQQPKANANASLYDIRAYFQGRNPKTNRMNNKSDDQTYMKLINDLREKLKDLAKKIEPKVYDYGFLKK